MLRHRTSAGMLSRAVQRARSSARRTKSARLPWLQSRRALETDSSFSPPRAASDPAALLNDLDALLSSYPLLEQAWPERIRLAVQRAANPNLPATVAGPFHHRRLARPSFPASPAPFLPGRLTEHALGQSSENERVA